MIKLRDSVQSDIPWLASNIRKADLMEIEAAGNPDPYRAFENGFGLSVPNAYTIVIDGIPAAMMGTSRPIDPETKIGTVWMLGTQDLEKRPIAFLRHMKNNYLPILERGYDALVNVIDSRNKLHIDFIKWLGFSIIRPIEMGDDKIKFYEFAKITNEGGS